MTSEIAGWFARTSRLLRPGRNPLARGCDRIEAILVRFAILVCVVAIPVAASIGSEVYANGRATAAVQAAERHPATATTLAEAPAAPVADGAVAQSGYADVPVQWWWPDNTERTASLPVASETPAGATVPVWLDEDGNLTTAPMTTADIAGTAATAAFAFWLGCLVVSLCLVQAVRLLLARRRSVWWAREWERFNEKLTRP
ncbi:Rv1733c family protein [Amycolatopsis thermoflava]